MRKEIINLVSELIKFETTTEDVNAQDYCMDYIISQFEGYDLNVQRKYCYERPALIVTFPNNKFNKVLLNGHIDVVPGNPEQFIPKVIAGNLIGRGAVDMKGSVAVFIKLLQDLSKQKKPPKIGLMLVSDEESGRHNSTSDLLNKGFLSEFGICGEPTQLRIGIRSKGALIYDIIVSGKKSHGSRPWEGKNAILNTFYNYRKIQKHFDNEKGWHCTINLTQIQGGSAINATPEECRVVLDVRYTKTEDVAEIDQLINKVFRTGVSKIGEYPVLDTPKKNKYVGLLKNACESTDNRKARFISQYGSSDTTAFAKLAIPAIEFGPRGRHWHGDKEYVEIDSLVEYYRILRKFVEAV